VQLGWPWLELVGAERLPGKLVPPEGALLGVMARQTLLAGAFRSVARAPLRDVVALRPELSQADRLRPVAWGDRRAEPRHGLGGHVTLVVPTPRGFELGSDVTTSSGETYRSGAVVRLTSLLLRAARRVGEEVAFDSSGPALWARLRERMHSLLLAFWHEGALGGGAPAEAFDVRCDETTMTQNDIDAGRVVCTVAFQAAAPIERISVVLALSAGSVAISGGQA
jgi:phage tail sheath protein FI